MESFSTDPTSKSPQIKLRKKEPMQFAAVEEAAEDQELMEDDEFDEELEDSLSSPAACSSGEESEGGTRLLSSGRSSVTLLTLLRERLLTPGEGAMSIHYLGQTFIGDLLPSGKIKSQETDLIFSSPSAWAIHCKKIINPDKKSGCGWASVKYRGRKLDAYKTAYFKKKRLDLSKENAPSEDEEMEKPVVTPAPRTAVKHNILGCRTANQDANTLVESVPFSALGKIQPFMVSITTNAVLAMDFHCHLTNSEVVGYLAGHWDVNAHNLAITHAFPCRCRLGDRELAPLVEADVWRAMEQRRVTLIGWYHSHPRSSATPSLRDIDAQMEYQIRMKGPSDASYIPCVGVICSPYNEEVVTSAPPTSVATTASPSSSSSTTTVAATTTTTTTTTTSTSTSTSTSTTPSSSSTLESSIVCYWVIPPPENRPQEYGRPMLMSYTVTQDQFLSQDALNEMKRCAEFYKGEPDAIKFTDIFRDSVTYVDKLKASLAPKFPRDQSDDIVWAFIRDLLALPESSPAETLVNSNTTSQGTQSNHEPEEVKTEVKSEPTATSSETNPPSDPETIPAPAANATEKPPASPTPNPVPVPEPTNTEPLAEPSTTTTKEQSSPPVAEPASESEKGKEGDSVQ